MANHFFYNRHLRWESWNHTENFAFIQLFVLCRFVWIPWHDNETWNQNWWYEKGLWFCYQFKGCLSSAKWKIDQATKETVKIMLTNNRQTRVQNWLLCIQSLPFKLKRFALLECCGKKPAISEFKNSKIIII